MSQEIKSVKKQALHRCDICCGNYPKDKHDFVECRSLDIEWDVKQINAIRDVETWRSKWIYNNNTGNKYEITTGEQILTLSGFGNKVIKSDNPLFTGVVGIISHTQNDECGTGDIEIIYSNKPSLMFSVTQYKKCLTKCIVNPSGKYYGISKKNFNKEVSKVYEYCIQYKKNKYGKKPSKKWRDREKIPAVKELHKLIAQCAAKNWNSFEKEHRINLLKKFLDLDTKNTRTNGIIFCSDKRICKMYLWKLKNNITLSNCLSATADGVYIYHHTRDNYKNTWFLRVQVKFNNGVIEFKKNTIPLEPKMGNTFTSWNSVAKLERIFDMEQLY